MTDNEAWRLERIYPVLTIDSKAPGLVYIVDSDKRGVIISGLKGMTGLSRRQAEVLCRELPEILEDYLGSAALEIGGKG